MNVKNIYIWQQKDNSLGFTFLGLQLPQLSTLLKPYTTDFFVFPFAISKIPQVTAFCFCLSLLALFSRASDYK